MNWIYSNQYLYVTLIILLLGFIFSLPFFKYLDEPKIKKLNNITSIRSWCCLFVLGGHSVSMYTFIKTGISQHNYYSSEYLGGIGVSIFFMITGFLFWKKISENDNVYWIDLLKDRIFRIVPVCFFNSIIIIILVLLFYSKFSWDAFNPSLLHWFTAGIQYIQTTHSINNFTSAWKLTSGVHWTLVFEWGFYFSLPLLYLFRKNAFQSSMIFLFIGIYITQVLPIQNIAFTGPLSVSCNLLFFLGIFSYEFSKKINLKPVYYEIFFVFSMLSLMFLQPTLYSVYSPSNILLIILFTSLLKGASGFGILKLKGFIRLGNISYSIYIMHGLVFYSVYNLLMNDIIKPSGKAVLHSSTYIYICPLTFLLITLVSSVTYKLIEIPFVNFGKKIKLNY